MVSTSQQIANQAQDATSDSTAFQRVFTADAPMMNYIGTKGDCKIIILPPDPQHGESVRTLTTGTFISDPTKKCGVMPVLGDYCLDWLYIYKGIGVNRKMDVLAAVWEEDEDGGHFLVEQSWGRGYKSPMYQLQEWLWKASGAPKFDKKTGRRVPQRDILDPRAAELLPYHNDLEAPMKTATRTLFLQGLVAENYAVNFLLDEEGRPQWPQHRILQINQISAIKSKTDVQPQEGIYDAFLKPTDNRTFEELAENIDPAELFENEQARVQWERENFENADFGTNLKLLVISHYLAGPAQIVTYKASVVPVMGTLPPGYEQLPPEVTKQIRPLSSYLIKTTKEEQVELLQELFSGYEWALIGAGLIEGNPAMVQGYTAPVNPAMNAAAGYAQPVMPPQVQPPMAVPPQVQPPVAPAAQPVPMAPGYNPIPMAPPPAVTPQYSPAAPTAPQYSPAAPTAPQYSPAAPGVPPAPVAPPAPAVPGVPPTPAASPPFPTVPTDDMGQSMSRLLNSLTETNNQQPQQ